MNKKIIAVFLLLLNANLTFAGLVANTCKSNVRPHREGVVNVTPSPINDRGESVLEIKVSETYTLNIVDRVKGKKDIMASGLTISLKLKGGKKVLQTGVTNEKGDVVFKDLKPGTYIASINCPEGKKLVKGNCVE